MPDTLLKCGKTTRFNALSLTNTCLFQSCSQVNFERNDVGFHQLWRAENTHNVKYNTSFDEPPVAVCKLLNLAVHWPSKVWPVSMIARKICSTVERNDIYKILYTTGHFIPKEYLSFVFYDYRNLEISKSKKSEQYFRDKIEIFICLSDEQLMLAILKFTDASRDIIHVWFWCFPNPLVNTFITQVSEKLTTCTLLNQVLLAARLCSLSVVV